MKKLFVLLTASLFILPMYAQTLEELNAMKAEKQAQASALAGEISSIQGKIDALPGWRKGAFGTLGWNLSSFSNWVSKANPNSLAINLGGSFNAYANLIEDKYFWRNSGNIGLGWQKLDAKGDGSGEYEQVTDFINLTSLFGRNITKSLAGSALAEYRSTLLNNINNPGFLDIGTGFTWTPTPPLVVVIHPLNYNIIFAEDANDYQSSLGAKVVADFNKKIMNVVNFRSNLSGFYSYKGIDLSNYTWVNSVAFTAFKGIGVGIEFGLRNNKQETAAANAKKDLQNYWLVGLTYSL